MVARCYVDVKATKVLGIDGQYYVTFDFTQSGGGEYNETASTLNKSKTFFRDIIRSYLLSESAPTWQTEWIGYPLRFQRRRTVQGIGLTISSKEKRQTISSQAWELFLGRLLRW